MNYCKKQHLYFMKWLWLIFFISPLFFCGCQENNPEPKGFIEQDSVYYSLNEDSIEISKTYFSLVVGFEGWEIQAADTGISVAYVASDDLTLTSTFFNAESDKILVPNFKNYNVPVNSPEVLRLSSNNSDKITRHTFGREKGKQFCYFSRCKESPALLRLILDFKKIDEYKIKKFPKGKLLLFVKVKSQSDTYYFRSLIKFKE